MKRNCENCIKIWREHITGQVVSDLEKELGLENGAERTIEQMTKLDNLVCDECRRLQDKQISLEDRMKINEKSLRTRVKLKSYVIIRIDGKAFSTYTKGLNKPFDYGLMQDMIETTRYLCENIQGAKLGYTQSDEISVLLTDLDNEKTNMWFDGQIQKMCSVAASLATSKFNQLRLARECDTWHIKYPAAGEYSASNIMNFKLAQFDARVLSFEAFNPQEVVNCFIWRQQDGIRNSKQALGQAYFSASKLSCKNVDEVCQMLREEKGIEWEDLRIFKQRGWCTIKKNQLWVRPQDNISFKPRQIESLDLIGQNTLEVGKIIDIMVHQGKEVPGILYERSAWIIDKEIPIFTENREYILKLLPNYERGVCFI